MQVLHQKAQKSLEEITNELCPVTWLTYLSKTPQCLMSTWHISSVNPHFTLTFIEKSHVQNTREKENDSNSYQCNLSFLALFFYISGVKYSTNIPYWNYVLGWQVWSTGIISRSKSLHLLPYLALMHDCGNHFQAFKFILSMANTWRHSVCFRKHHRRRPRNNTLKK